MPCRQDVQMQDSLYMHRSSLSYSKHAGEKTDLSVFFGFLKTDVGSVVGFLKTAVSVWFSVNRPTTIFDKYNKTS